MVTFLFSFEHSKVFFSSDAVVRGLGTQVHVWESRGTATSQALCFAVRGLSSFTSIPNQRKQGGSEEALYDRNEIRFTSYSWLQKLSMLENCDESVTPMKGNN